jgi:hypothetical protein
VGIAAAPLEFLVGASMFVRYIIGHFFSSNMIGSTRNDIYHVHERSMPVAIWNLALINGINITRELIFCGL